MTTFDIETQGRDLVRPLIEMWVEPGSLWDTNEARQREAWQRFAGDYVGRTRGTTELVGFEIKTERKFTGNLFVESWSNKSGVWDRAGWIFTLNTDVLVSVFLDVRAAFVMKFSSLKKWCLTDGNMYRYAEKPVHRSLNREQMNLTMGYPVPIAHMLEPVDIRCYRVGSGGFWEHSTLFAIRDIREAV